jgi:hypothetical protein
VLDDWIINVPDTGIIELIMGPQRPHSFSFLVLQKSLNMSRLDTAILKFAEEGGNGSIKGSPSNHVISAIENQHE